MIKIVEEPPPPKRIPCLYCDQEISSRARICFHCNRPQKWWKVHHLEMASLLGVVLALGLLILSVFQYQDTKKDRIDAKKALERSTKALERASLAEAKLNRQRVDINRYSAQLFSSICTISGGVYQSGTLTCQLLDGRAIKYNPVFRDDQPKDQ
jgi:hypothetical protein